MSKLPNATRETMTPAQQKIWDKVHEGKTGGGGPYSMLMHSPEMAQHFAATEDYFRNNSLLSDADREVIILTAAREVEAHYAWSRHEIRAHNVGVKPDVIEAIRAHADTGKFTGKEQLAQALGLEVAKYPTAEEAAKALVERFNTVVSFGTNAEAAAKYDKYLSADKERLGVGAVRQDVVLPAFTEAIIGSPEDGAAVMASPDEWTAWVEETAHEVGHRWQTTKEQTPYKYSCELNTAKTEGGVVFNSGDPASGLEHGTIFIKCLDNLDETDLGSRQLADGTVGYNSLNSKQAWFVDLQQKDGKWKVVGMQTEEMLQ